uniref:Uncharacterized protein n=1 Tax=Desertifilum tharense IPPAS B-1220 TaxID=1781255 RepID=A0ACD5GUP2_9CYAN
MTQLLDDVLTLGAIESGKIPFQPILINLGEFCQQLCEELKGDRELQRSQPENEAYPYPVLPPSALPKQAIPPPLSIVTYCATFWQIYSPTP